MSGVRPHRVLVVLLFVLAGLIVNLSPAHALSCVSAQEVYDRSGTAFAGRIVGADHGRLTVEVDEIWKGDQLPRRLSLGVDLVGWTEWADAQKVRDGYTSPDTWLFVPEVTGTRGLVVNPCSAWRTRESFIKPLQPTTVTTPDVEYPILDHTPSPTLEAAAAPGSEAEPDEDGPNLLVRVGFPLAGAAMLVGVVLLVRRRRG